MFIKDFKWQQSSKSIITKSFDGLNILSPKATWEDDDRDA